MIEHIIKNNESINDIISLYNVSLDELKKCNNHITDFKNLVGGTKMRIPLISEEIEQILETTESFIADYYSKISDEILNDFNDKKNKMTVEIKTDEKIEERILPNREVIKKAYPGITPPKKPYNGRI